MPAISKIRFTNAIYENGGKRYNDEIFVFDGYNGAVLLENGGGKTVFVQIALQAILPHSDLGNRKIRDTLALEGNPCHIAIEWITNEMPRRYALTAITLFLNNGRLDSYKYVYEYGHDDDHSIENLPFVKKTPDGNKRPASKEEMGDYFQYICRENINAKTFPTIKSYHKYIEENFKIISTEWRSIGIINGEEGGVDKFFEGCRTTENLIDKLLIPVVEEAMAGNGTEDFVSTFEKQREHFKQHNHLKESIDESKQIQNKIEDYVDIYDEYYKSIGKYNGEKAYGKALYQYIDNEEKDMEIKLNENKNSQNQCKNEFEEQDRMDGSYNLACLKNRFLSFKSKYEDILKNYEIFKDELDTKDSRIQNLKIAKYKKNIKELEDGIALYKKQLESLEKDEEIYDIEKNLKLNSSNIKGYFEFEFKELNKEVSILENKKTKYENELKEFKSMKASLDKEYDELSENRIRLDQDLNTNKKNMNGIKKEILSNPETEKIEDEYLGWGKRVSDIEKYLVDYKEKLKFYKDEKYNLKLELPKYRKQLGIQSSNRSTLKEKINNIKDREEELLLNIKEYIPNLFHTNSIYTKQEQIIGTLENRCERIRKEKENLIIEERMVHRFIDDYNDNDYFTAEPLLDQWLQDWKDQFSFLESGAQYIERAARNMDSNEKEYYKSYPYWAAAVVVADNEENKLKAKLENHIDKITYPIVILTQSSAQEILQNEIVDEYTYLYPLVWETNIIKGDFKDKKHEIVKETEKATKNRKQKENEFNNYDNLLINTVEFLNKYPYLECFAPLNDELKHLEEETYNIKNIIRKKSARIEEIDEEIESINNEIGNLNTEKDILNKKIEKAINYINKKREIEGIRNEIFRLKSRLTKKENEISKLRRLIKSDIEIINELKDKIKEMNRSINNMIQSDLYKEVEKFVPTESEISIEVLKREREDIKDLLDEKQKDRRHLEDNINQSYSTKENYEKNLKNEIKTAKYPINENLIFPLYGEREIEDLSDQINELRPKVIIIQSEMNNAREKYLNAESKYNVREEDFFKKYDEIVEFTESLYIVKERIYEKRQELNKRYGYLRSMEEKCNKEFSSIKSALNLLKMKNEKHEYLASKIKPSIFSEEIRAELSYNRKDYIDKLIKNLDNLNSQVKEKKEKVSKGKTIVETFCNQSIRDPRLKNMAISGVNHKNNFEDLFIWKKIIDKRINRTIKILEEDMRGHDKEINQFINHLDSYLRTLAEEISNIPKKTRIKVDDKWKAVYTIDVPIWDKETGKEKLIEYINWLLKDIEDIRFKDEGGNENKAYVRKYIEKKFQAKELLKTVMGNDKIKVKCRKVTNDGKVSSIPISWERSNRWSGGEKWSKNMTLFLGILNYLAEKRQNISSNQKRNRTVILDNPFGKASSDHVLDPVFFIAEQLGFQIIALTAHSEGKYIRDFFPVVYSCRLRPSVDNETLILMKDKEISYAFFKDKDPQALLRLGDVKQLSML